MNSDGIHNPNHRFAKVTNPHNTWKNILCDNCCDVKGKKRCSIFGDRYKCKELNDFDLCAECFNNGVSINDKTEYIKMNRKSPSEIVNEDVSMVKSEVNNEHEDKDLIVIGKSIDIEQEVLQDEIISGSNDENVVLDLDLEEKVIKEDIKEEMEKPNEEENIICVPLQDTKRDLRKFS